VRGEVGTCKLIQSAHNSQAPIKSKAGVYPLINEDPFEYVLDCSLGLITKLEFEGWHAQTLHGLVRMNEELNRQYGWLANMVNIYLKTYCYIGDGGCLGIRSMLHPPIDTGLWEGVNQTRAPGKPSQSLKALRSAALGWCGLNQRGSLAVVIKES
jgi:hypothetical protein